MSINIAHTESYGELTREGFVIVDFYSTTCVPCKMQSRVLEDLTEDYPFVNIVKVNVTDDPKLGVDHQIEAVPTVKFLRDGEELETIVGLMDEDEIVEKIGEYFYA